MDAMDFSNLQFPCFLLIISFLIPFSGGQAPPPAANDCTGIFLSYDYISGSKIYPYFSNHSLQPYSFKSRITLLNTDSDDLKSWNVFVGFQHREILVSASQAVLSDGSSLPAAVGNGTYFSGFPQTDLNNAIDTAGDWTQILVQIDLSGTQFGVSPPGVPMPANISIANDGFDCAKPGRQGNATMYVCCSKNPNFKANISEDTKFLPRQDGDLTIDYDIIQAYEANYLAQVTISNNNPLGRLDNWKLNWEWMQQEFIYSMKGAYPQVIDPSDCIFGAQGMFYQNLDFSPVLNCQKSPTIVDLPPNKANDTIVGMIPFCCRNGTLLPPSMDPSKSKSAFQLQVYKMPPNLNRTQLFAPQNWKISGEINPDYQCAPPRRVSPTQFPNTNGLQSTTSAIASWQVVCNITQHKNSNPQCCVSFSAFYNESVIPCKTCACGCPAVSNPTCSTTTPALFLPSEALLVPFENRTKMALAWADLKHFHVPNQMPCGDNCGVSINWHVFTDHSRGWSARITLFNWEGISYGDWFTAVELDKAYPGYEGVYSFNGTTLPELNNTIFMQGLPGLNYLVGEVAGANPRRDTPIPGKQQSVISFTKKKTPGINVVGGDGFPTKVFFNGEECSVPSVIPSGHEHRAASINLLSLVLVAVVCLVMMDQLW